MSKTKIEWAQHSWNPVTGCTKVSEGCRNCYAERMARRLAGRYGYPEAPRHFDVTLHPDRLNVPLRRVKPTTYFVCSMSDLFHEDVPLDYIADVWGVMYQCPQHTFQVLTKRPDRMCEVIQAIHDWNYADTMWTGQSPPYFSADQPFPNVWMGVSVEDQRTADERIPILLQIPAAVRFISAEPLFGAIDLDGYLGDLIQLSDFDGHVGDGLDWIIVGGESGPGARPMDENWVRDLRDQCVASGTPFFYKQRLENGHKISLPELDGCAWDEMPEVMK